MTAPALDVERLRALSEDALDAALRDFARAHGAAAVDALSALAEGGERAGTGPAASAPAPDPTTIRNGLAALARG